MRAYTLTHLTDASLMRDLAALVARDRTTTAELLAHLAEVDERKLYLPAAYSSLYAYCIGELRMSEDSAFKRIRAARTARRFPPIFEYVAEGRLHLSAVVLLAPYLTDKTADELLADAANKSKSELEELLARRFPQSDVPTRIDAVATSSPACQLAPGPVEPGMPEFVGSIAAEKVEDRALAMASELAPGPVELRRHRLAPLSPERFALQLTIGKTTHDKLRYAQALLGHAVPSGDIAEVLDRALDALIGGLEKRKFASTSLPRPRQHSSANNRHVPAHVKRAVWARDQGQCTFVGTTGHRCAARRGLEFDHVEPVARGGQSTVTGMRLRCRAHNQYEAERAFGVSFMQDKRDAARRVADNDKTQDVMAGLHTLGFRADEARRAAEHAATLHGASLEKRMRAALRFAGRRASP